MKLPDFGDSRESPKKIYREKVIIIYKRILREYPEYHKNQLIS